MNKVKQISFPEELLSYVQLRLEGLGIGLPEYIRHLVLNDTRDLRESISLSDSEEASLAEAINDLAKGNYTVHKDKNSMRNYLKNLLKD